MTVGDIGTSRRPVLLFVGPMVLRRSARCRTRMTPAAKAGEGDRDDERAPQTALPYLETRARLAALRAEGEACFLAAFRPLYEALSADQRKTADELLTQRRP